ncbi:MAG: ABC transporter ATP-binding protein [Candidatus Eisenbacteria bacterium]|jgi:ABC-2 type transport system ATP-binding protein|nr:ABC transporter ATP-binding protein [Candidatus Eisenbacteria bacterium]
MNPSPTVVIAEDLSRAFGDFVAVDRVSFQVHRGEVFGFLGSNGAGKTTTIRMLCGLLSPSGGRAAVMGQDVAAHPMAVKRHIGYMSQRFSLYRDLTVRENLRFWGGAYGLRGRPLAEREAWAVEIGGLDGLEDSLVRHLPGGFAQRLALGCALLHRPPVVFLDEPTGGVDPEARRRFWDLIEGLSGGGTTVFVTTHYMDEAERCHRVALMHAGRLLAMDSIAGLRGVFGKAVLVEIHCPMAPQALATIARIPGVTETALFGERVHAVLEHSELQERVRKELAAAGFAPAELECIPPSLEDVFIHVIGEADRT